MITTGFLLMSAAGVWAVAGGILDLPQAQIPWASALLGAGFAVAMIGILLS